MYCIHQNAKQKRLKCQVSVLGNTSETGHKEKEASWKKIKEKKANGRDSAEKRFENFSQIRDGKPGRVQVQVY